MIFVNVKKRPIVRNNLPVDCKQCPCCENSIFHHVLYEYLGKGEEYKTVRQCRINLEGIGTYTLDLVQNCFTDTDELLAGCSYFEFTDREQDIYILLGLHAHFGKKPMEMYIWASGQNQEIAKKCEEPIDVYGENLIRCEWEYSKGTEKKTGYVWYGNCTLQSVYESKNSAEIAFGVPFDKMPTGLELSFPENKELRSYTNEEIEAGSVEEFDALILRDYTEDEENGCVWSLMEIFNGVYKEIADVPWKAYDFKKHIAGEKTPCLTKSDPCGPEDVVRQPIIIINSDNPPDPEPPSPEPPSPEPPSPEPPSPEPPSPEEPSPEEPSPEPPESGSSSLSESKSESTSSSASSSGSDPWNGETRKIDRWLAKCGEIEAGKWFLKRGGTYTLTYQEYLNLLSVANFTGMDIWMCRGNPGDNCDTGEILVDAGKDPGTPPWNCYVSCEAPMLMTMGFYDEVVRLKHRGYCYIWNSDIDYSNTQRGDWYVEAYTYQDYSSAPINVIVNIIYAEPYIEDVRDENKQEMAQYDDGVSWMPNTKGSFKFDVWVSNPLDPCCVNNFLNPPGGIKLVDAWWYSDRNTPPLLTGNWGWVGGDYQCWALQEDTTGAYWLKFAVDKTEEGE